MVAKEEFLEHIEVAVDLLRCGIVQSSSIDLVDRSTFQGGIAFQEALNPAIAQTTLNNSNLLVWAWIEYFGHFINKHFVPLRDSQVKNP